jgi:2-methylcitrate dehydratase PrpD
LESYSDEAVADTDIQRIANCIQVKEDPAYTAMLPDIRPARVEVILADGRKMEKVVERPAGGFDNPFPEEHLADKFRRLAGMVTADSQLTELTQTIDRLPELRDLSELSFLLRAGR